MLLMDEKLENYINLSKDEVLSSLQSTEKGLSEKTAGERLKTYGYNEITSGHKRSVFIQSLLHSLNPLVGILFIAAGVSAFTGNMANASIIMFVLLISVVLDYIQSHRSIKAVQQLQAQVSLQTTVIRDNQTKDIQSKRLVPGDIIRLLAGDLVPADSFLLASKDLHVQQGALTGESLPIEKAASNSGKKNNNTDQAIYELTNLVFSGSSIVSGTATALVLCTGKNTLFGKIAQNLALRPPPTEFDKGLVQFGILISKTILFLILFVLLISFLFKGAFLESLMFSIALAVGLTPEFLPMITTVTLATGAVRMASKHVIVKNLASLQNLGSIDILCSDKTGTLTTGEMHLEQYLLLSSEPSEKLLLYAYLNSLFQSGVEYPEKTSILKHVNRNPLDTAILEHEHPDIRLYNKMDELPFDFERRCSSVVVSYDSTHMLIAKGAPENIIKKCVSYDNGETIVRIDNTLCEQYTTLFQSLSAKGYRLLAVGYRIMTPQSDYSLKDEDELTLSGLLVFADPPLPDAEKVILSLKGEGVSIKILTGDNELVSESICREIGMDPGHIILGTEIEQLSELELAAVAENTLVFARISPSQKQRIISALRSRGHVVGYIGDGINDAPSLHSADVGISVSGAVDVAREAADIILLEPHLKILLIGILEGRKAFGNVMKYLMMGTSSNFGNMFSMAAAFIFLPFLPMLPSQILLNNLLYDLSQLWIPTDHVDKKFTRKPRHWDLAIIRKFMFYIGPISSIFDFITFYVMLHVFSASTSLFQTGWFVESLATQTLVIFVIRTSQNPFRSRPSLPLIISVISVVLIGSYLPFSPFGALLGFTPLPFVYFIFLISATFVYLCLVQIVKQRLMWRWFS
jgi:Mg2+-importing ATPase